MWLRKMNFNTKFFTIILFWMILSCQKDNPQPIYSNECADCIEHHYQQVYNDSLIDLVMVYGTYCIGDSAWNTPDGSSYWIQIDQDLMNLLTESGYCQYLELQDTLN